MELFVINRYTGDESKAQTPNEVELREKLLQKIKERKQLAQSSVENVDNFKHKKRKKSVESELLIESNQNEITVDEDLKKERKKKKKIKTDVCTSEDLEYKNNSSLESQDENKTPKKKHKKKDSSTEDSKNTETSLNETDLITNEENLDGIEKEHSGFTILGDVHMSKKNKVKRKLPNWLANPSIVSVDLKNLTCTVDSIPELDKIFIDKLKENNITHFFPVQSQMIPWLLKNSNRPHMYWPNDICVSAPTGSGKTLAFVLPILQVLYKRVIPRIRALVVLPVQDLANQVFKVFETYSKGTNLNILLLCTKRTFVEEQSLICKTDGMGNYRTLIDIIVTTPGRLVEHLTKTKGLCLSNLTYLVIDEADRVMEKVQNDWLYHLNKHINLEATRSYQVPVISYNNMINKKKPPNKLLFSATLSQDPEKLQQLGLFQPKLFTSVVKSNTNIEDDVKDETKFIGKYTTPTELTEYYTISTKTNKPLLVHHLLTSKSWKNVLCFVNSSEATSRLAFVLKVLSKKRIKTGVLSGNLTVRKRDIVLNRFLNGEIDVLVSSDALARGIDIPSVKYVISYDAPRFIKTYVHRIGRTGRAGKEGTSLALLTSKEINRFQKMIETAGKSKVEELKISPDELKQYEASYEKALETLGNVLEKRKHRILQKVKTIRKRQLLVSEGKLNRIKKNSKKNDIKKKRNKTE